MSFWPAVYLPSPEGLNPNLGPLLEMPFQVLSEVGPRAAYLECDRIATGFFQAVDSNSIVRAGGKVISQKDIEDVAEWLASCSRALVSAVH